MIEILASLAAGGTVSLCLMVLLHSIPPKNSFEGSIYAIVFMVSLMSVAGFLQGVFR